MFSDNVHTSTCNLQFGCAPLLGLYSTYAMWELRKKKGKPLLLNVYFILAMILRSRDFYFQDTKGKLRSKQVIWLYLWLYSQHIFPTISYNVSKHFSRVLIPCTLYIFSECLQNEDGRLYLIQRKWLTKRKAKRLHASTGCHTAKQVTITNESQ